MTVAVVIARGGSKRLPGKNGRQFCGVPLVGLSIMQARAAQQIDAVVLSTDDDNLAAIGEAYGAEVLRRPNWEDADQVAANRVYLHAVAEIEKHVSPDQLVQVLPTSPLRKPEDFDRGIALSRKLGGSVVGMCRRRETFVFEEVHPRIARARIMDKRRMHFDIASGNLNVVPWQWYAEIAGNIPCGDHDKALDEMNRRIDLTYQTEFYFLELAPWQVWEVDVQEEWDVAELLMEHFILKGRHPSEVYRPAWDQWSRVFP